MENLQNYSKTPPSSSTTNPSCSKDPNSTNCCMISKLSKCCACMDFKWIIERSKNVLMDPKGVWDSIQKDEHSIQDIYKKFAFVVLAIAPLAGILTSILYGFFSGDILSLTIIRYVAALAGVLVSAWVLQFLAPKFQGKTDLTSAIKLVVYPQATTALAAIICILPFGKLVPLIRFVGGIYGLYIIYQGITPMTGVPKENSVVYLLSCAGIMLVVGIVFASLCVAVSF